jgi:hypothetical protein
MQKEKTLYQKYWWIPLTVIVIGTAVAFMVAGDKNNPEISSIDVSNVESRDISGENRKVVPAREFRQFFYDNLGFQDNNLFDTYDSEYVLVTERDM